MRISDWSSDVCSSDLSARCIFPSADQQPARPFADTAHRFDGVDDQVKDHLLQLDSISLNDRQALRELRLHRDIVFHHFATGQGNDLNDRRSEEHTSELQSLMRISYAVFCLKKKNYKT